ncbi:MAG: serine hydrolase [Gemmataceae bacterium]|nr:serine hydrolase [Gemmataceae bacterium]
MFRPIRSVLAAAVLAVLLISPPVRAGGFDPAPVDEVVEKALKEFNAPGAAVVVVQDGEVVYLKGFGVRKKGAAEKVTPDTVFPIASCSKAFTATLVAMLVDEGKLKWDDKVRDHLDSFRLADELADREVTLRDLLSHRTGMPRHDLLGFGLTADTGDLIRRWGRGRPSTSFRSTWEYSNVPFTTAGVVAGKVTKTDWAAATRQRIFDPLGMTASSTTVKEGQAAADHATPHYYGFDRVIRPIDWDEIDHMGGAGCVNSTARDMGEWLRFQLAGGRAGTKRLVASKVLKETHTPQMLLKAEGVWSIYFPAKAGAFTTYGLGWFVHDYRGHVCVSHGGTLTGFRAQCMLIPEKKTGVFVASNLRPSLVTEAVAKTVLDYALGLPAEDWVKAHKSSLAALDFDVALARKKRETARKPDTKPALEPAKYAGKYDETAYGRAEVKEKDGTLTVHWGRYTFRLDHYHFDTFTAVPVEPKDEVVSFDRATFEAQFRLGADGEVESLKFLDQEFRRVKK